MTRGCHSSCGAIPSELIRCYGRVTKTGAGVPAITAKVEERGVNAERGGGSAPPYSTAENNNHAVMQHPKHLLGKHCLERSYREAARSYNIHQGPAADEKRQPLASKLQS